MMLSGVILVDRVALVMKVSSMVLLSARVSSIEVAISMARVIVWQRRHIVSGLHMMLCLKFVFAVKWGEQLIPAQAKQLVALTRGAFRFVSFPMFSKLGGLCDRSLVF